MANPPMFASNNSRPAIFQPRNLPGIPDDHSAPAPPLRQRAGRGFRGPPGPRRHGLRRLGRGPRRVDVGIRGDRIVFVGNAAQAGSPRGEPSTPTGLIVSPGFIDPHTHSFEGLPNLSQERRKNTGALMQGVTTVVTGADGRGPLDVARVLTEAERLGHRHQHLRPGRIRHARGCG